MRLTQAEVKLGRKPGTKWLIQKDLATTQKYRKQV